MNQLSSVSRPACNYITVPSSDFAAAAPLRSGIVRAQENMHNLFPQIMSYLGLKGIALCSTLSRHHRTTLALKVFQHLYSESECAERMHLQCHMRRIKYVFSRYMLIIARIEEYDVSQLRDDHLPFGARERGNATTSLRALRRQQMIAQGSAEVTVYEKTLKEYYGKALPKPGSTLALLLSKPEPEFAYFENHNASSDALRLHLESSCSETQVQAINQLQKLLRPLTTFEKMRTVAPIAFFWLTSAYCSYLLGITAPLTLLAPPVPGIAYALHKGWKDAQHNRSILTEIHNANRALPSTREYLAIATYNNRLPQSRCQRVTQVAKNYWSTLCMVRDLFLTPIFSLLGYGMHKVVHR